MSAEDTLFGGAQRVGDFAFDRRVAQVFDDMIARSIPYYDEIQRMQAELVLDLLPEGESLVCDLGCSTGTTLARLAGHPRCPDAARLHGIDDSPDMLRKAREKLAESIEAGRVTLERTHLDASPHIPPCHVVLMNWTLQFVRPIHRESLVRAVYSALHHGGALFLSEKMLVADGMLNRLYIEHYLRYKTERGGYSDREIQNKREALENVLVPYRIDENQTLLERAGFDVIDTYFRWFNFACMIAIKR